MSEKRFVVFIDSKDTCNLYDEETHCFYEIHDSARNVDILCERLNELSTENRQLKEDIMFWKQEAKELKKEADYFERKKCEYWNMYNEAHLDRIILKKENEQLKQELAELLAVHTKIVETLDSEFVSKALEDGD